MVVAAAGSVRFKTSPGAVVGFPLNGDCRIRLGRDVERIRIGPPMMVVPPERFQQGCPAIDGDRTPVPTSGSTAWSTLMAIVVAAWMRRPFIAKSSPALNVSDAVVSWTVTPASIVMSSSVAAVSVAVYVIPPVVIASVANVIGLAALIKLVPPVVIAAPCHC